MLKDLIFPIISGVVSTLIANWLAKESGQFSENNRLVISFVAGLIVAAIVFWGFRYFKSKSTPEEPIKPGSDGLMNDYKGVEGIEIKGTKLDTKDSRNLSNWKTDKKIVVSDVEINKGGANDDAKN